MLKSVGQTWDDEKWSFACSSRKRCCRPRGIAQRLWLQRHIQREKPGKLRSCSMSCANVNVTLSGCACVFTCVHVSMAAAAHTARKAKRAQVWLNVLDKCMWWHVCACVCALFRIRLISAPHIVMSYLTVTFEEALWARYMRQLLRLLCMGEFRCFTAHRHSHEQTVGIVQADRHNKIDQLPRYAISRLGSSVDGKTEQPREAAQKSQHEGPGCAVSGTHSHLVCKSVILFVLFAFVSVFWSQLGLFIVATVVIFFSTCVYAYFSEHFCTYCLLVGAVPELYRSIDERLFLHFRLLTSIRW